MAEPKNPQKANAEAELMAAQTQDSSVDVERDERNKREVAALEREIDTEQTALERRQTWNVARVADDVVPDSWESAYEIMQSIGAVVSEADEELADEWPLIEKAKLVNVESLFITWSISDPHNETFGAPYIVVRGMTRAGKRFRFTDGSTGICSQLMSFTQKRIKEGVQVPNAGLHLKHGLSKSDYKTTVTDQKTGELVEIPATTYYINNETD